MARRQHIPLVPNRVYRVEYRDHLGKTQSRVVKVLRQYEANPSSFILPTRPRPILSVEAQVQAETNVGKMGGPPVISFALDDLFAAQEILP